MKNLGLYVGFSGREWQTPASISKAEFDRARDMASQFVELVELMVKEDDPAQRGVILGVKPDAEPEPKWVAPWASKPTAPKLDS